MADLVVVVPSRGRPDALVDLERVFRETCTAQTRLMVAVDEDDPTLPSYLPESVLRTVGRHTSMVEALNHAAVDLVSGPDAPFAVGFMGDDHRPRTLGWDRAYLAALVEMGTGIVYGDDLLQRQQLATQCAMTSDIVRALGFMAPPTLRHMYVDNFWMTLGAALGGLRYLPDVVVEHLHPFAGKALMDEGYVRVNTAEVYGQDQAAFDRYLRDQFPADVEKVEKVRAVAVRA